MLTVEVRIGQNVAKCNKLGLEQGVKGSAQISFSRRLGWETVYITDNSTKKPEPIELPDCEVKTLSDLSEYQKLANLQYQRDVKGVWISGKAYLLS